jgi:phospholipid/cholesterol/gamma-HCH transport system substrate-binding protein
MARGKLSQGTQRASQVRVGLVLIAAVLILVFSVYQVGRLFDVFAARYELVTFVENSSGIMAGAPVTLAGQRIGQVDEVEFIPVAERVGTANIRMRLAVNRAVQDQIRQDSRAKLRTQGLLGDRFIDITPGSATLPMLQAGDTIVAVPALEMEAVLETAAALLDDVHAVAVDLQTTTERLARGEGTLGALLTDDRLYERLTVATGELSALLTTVNRADGTVGRLIRDPALYEQMERSLATLERVGTDILAGEGTLGRLLHDDALYEELLAIAGRADTTLAGVQRYVEGAAEAEGTLHRLLHDPELYDQFLRAVVDVQNLIRAIRENPREYRPEVRIRVF